MKLILLLIANCLVLTCIASNLGNGGVFNSPEANAYWKQRFGSNFGGSSVQKETSSPAFKQRFGTSPINNEISYRSKPSGSASPNSYKNRFSSSNKASYGRQYTSPKLFKTRFGSSSPYYIPYTSTSPHYNPPKTTGSTASYPSNKRAYSRTPPIHTSSAYGFHYQKTPFYPRVIYQPQTPRYILRSSTTPYWHRPSAFYY
uniref:Uncharacterized protein n=1 Tax=Lepeophtheirus salmonis TaxID=72036 RepID=A0A0K2UJ41_LEPSM